MTVSAQIQQWTQKILKPAVDQARFDQAMNDIRHRSPPPVLWLLGKTQSGKSSIIQALTGSTRAEIGQGFRSCTRTADVYDFPDEETAFIRFLDTRGLGEVGYDPTDDMAYCEARSSLLVITLKADDHQLDEVVKAACRIRKDHPDWPFLVVQTCLHEAYADLEQGHILPYPFSDGELGACVPPRLALTLSTQRSALEGLGGRFVVIDFTRPEDGYDPVYYGLDALWAAIEDVLPAGLARLMRETLAHRQSLNDVYSRTVHPHVVGYAITAGLLGAIPVPVVNLSLVLAAQAKMLHSIASIYGVSLTARSLGEVASAVGMGGLMARYGVNELASLIPGWGSAIAGLSSAAITYGLGKTLDFYYGQTRQGAAFSRDMLREVYRKEFEQGRALLARRFGGESAGQASGRDTRSFKAG
ncbi:MAG: hypothetical protein RLZZ226_418 [Pseudomonadota bacterium]